MSVLFKQTSRVREYDSLWSSGRVKKSLIYSVEDETKRGIQLGPIYYEGSMIVEYDLGDAVFRFDSFEMDTVIEGSGQLTTQYRSSEDCETWTSWTSDLPGLAADRFLQVLFTFTRSALTDDVVLQYTKVTYTLSTGHDIPNEILDQIDEQAVNVEGKVTIETKDRVWSDSTRLPASVNFGGFSAFGTNTVHMFDTFKMSDSNILIAYSKALAGGKHGIVVRSYNPSENTVGDVTYEATCGEGYDKTQPFRINYIPGAFGYAGKYWVVYVNNDIIKTSSNIHPWAQAWTVSTLYDGSQTISLRYQYKIFVSSDTGNVKTVYPTQTFTDPDAGEFADFSQSGFTYYTDPNRPGQRIYRTVTDNSYVIYSFEGRQLYVWINAWASIYTWKYDIGYTVHYRKNGTSKWLTDPQYCFDKTGRKTGIDHTWFRVFEHPSFDRWDVKITFLLPADPNIPEPIYGVLGLEKPEGRVSCFKDYIANAPTTQENIVNWFRTNLSHLTDYTKDYLEISTRPGVNYYGGWRFALKFKEPSDKWYAWNEKCYLTRIKFTIANQSVFDDNWTVKVIGVKENGKMAEVAIYQGKSNDWYYWRRDLHKTINLDVSGQEYVSWFLEFYCSINAFWQGAVGYWRIDDYLADTPNLGNFKIRITNIETHGIKETLAGQYLDVGFAEAYGTAQFGTETGTEGVNLMDAFVTPTRENVNNDWIKEWLMIGYWDGYGDSDEALASTNQVSGAIQPAAGVIEDSKTWVKYLSRNNTYFDFRAWWSGDPGPSNCAAWACTYVYSPLSENKDVTLYYGCDDGIRIYVLGPTHTIINDARKVAEKTGTRHVTANDFSCTATLYPGWNRIYVKSSNSALLSNRWGFRISISEGDLQAYGFVINTGKYVGRSMLAIAYQSPMHTLLGSDLEWHEGYDDYDDTPNNWYYSSDGSSCMIRTKVGVTYSEGWEGQFRWTKPSKYENVALVQFDYDSNLPSGWYLNVCDENETIKKTYTYTSAASGTDQTALFSGGTPRISFRLKRTSGGDIAPGDSVYIRISNIKIYYLSGSKHSFMHCRLNWSGDPDDWDQPTASKTYILWDDFFPAARPEAAFFQEDGALFCYAQHISNTGKTKLLLYELNSSLSLAPDYWESHNLKTYSWTGSYATRLRYLNVGIDKEYRHYITHNVITPSSQNTSISPNFFSTYHRRWLGSMIPVPDGDMIVAVEPLKNSIIAFIAKQNDPNRIYIRTIKNTLTKVNISKFVDVFDINRSVSSGSDSMSITTLKKVTVPDVTHKEDILNPYTANGIYEGLIPVDQNDKKPRFIKAYLARYYPNETKVFTPVFSGILGNIDDSMQRTSTTMNLEVVGFASQLNKFNAPDAYLYASPVHVWLDTFLDNYNVVLSSIQKVKPQRPSTKYWTNTNLEFFAVNPERGSMQHKATTRHSIIGKSVYPHTNAGFCASIYCPTAQTWQIWLQGSSDGNDLCLQYTHTTNKLQLIESGVETIATVDYTITPNLWYHVSIYYYRGTGNVQVYINGKKVLTANKKKEYKKYAFKWAPNNDAMIKNPRILRLDTGDIEKLDFDIVKDVLYKASQGMLPLEFKEPGFRNVLVGFVAWQPGESALDFINRLAKMFNCRYYFDGAGVFVWEQNIIEPEAITIGSSWFDNFRRTYNNFDYTNWIHVYCENEGSIYQYDAVDADMVARFGVRYSLVEDSAIEDNEHAKLRALQEFYSADAGHEEASLDLIWPLFELEPSMSLELRYPDEGIDELYFVKGLSMSYSKNNKNIKVSLDLDSRAKAQREFVAGIYEGGLVRYEQ